MGLVALASLGVLAWQRRPLDVARAAVLSGAEGRPTAAWDRALEDARRLDVNTADAAELARLPEVGPALAQRILAERRLRGRFRDPEGLLRVQGIGPKTLDALRDHVKTEE